MNLKGFFNSDSNCYMNAILQSLLSCFPYFFESIANKKDKYIIKNNRLGVLFFNFLKLFLIENNTDNISQNEKNVINTEISTFPIKIINALESNLTGQQCVHEIITQLIDKLELDDYVQCFYFKKFICMNCNNLYSSNNDYLSLQFIDKDKDRIKNLKIFKKSEEKQIILPITLTPDNINTDENSLFNSCSDNVFEIFINNHINIIDDYYCEQCKRKSRIIIVNQIKKISPIMILSLNKFFDKFLIKFPEQISIKINNDIFKYKLVSSIDHIGIDTRGGHYISQTLNYRNNKWYNTNDMDIQEKEKCIPNRYSFLLFYIKINE